MIDPFAMALTRLHGAAGSVAAVYTPPGGGAIPIRVIREQGDREVRAGMGRVIVDANAVQIQRSDIARPVAGALVTIGVETFAIQGGPVLDSEGVTWTCNLEPA